MSATLQPPVASAALAQPDFRRPGLPRRAWIAFAILSLLTAITFPVWTHYEQPAWDAEIYLKAVRSIAAGHDPYADAIAVQKLAHSLHPNAPSNSGPFSYVYSPITLPVLRLVAATPHWVAAGIFWLCYLAGILGELAFGAAALQAQERRYLFALAPIAIFFPGFLAHDIILSGNVAYILYGLVLTCTLIAWRRGQWRWFYLAVLAASCVKAPLLSLLAIPVLSARRQRFPVIATGIAGIALFAIQPIFWPTFFHNYLEAVELQFSFNRDFGFSPAGIFSGILYDHHIPYSPACTLFYLAYSIPLFVGLYFLSRQFLRGRFTLEQWMPVLLLGVILLNPRLIEYDAAPLAIPLAVIAWRFFARYLSTTHTILATVGLFLTLNVIAFQSQEWWKLTEAPLLVVFFVAGVFTLVGKDAGYGVRAAQSS